MNKTGKKVLFLFFAFMCVTAAGIFAPGQQTKVNAAATTPVMLYDGVSQYDVTGDGKPDTIKLVPAKRDADVSGIGGGWKILVNNKVVWKQKEQGAYYRFEVNLYRVNNKKIFFDIVLFSPSEYGAAGSHIMCQMKNGKLKTVCDFTSSLLKYMNDGWLDITVKSLDAKTMVVETHNQFYATGLLYWQMSYKYKGGKWQQKGSAFNVYRENVEKWTVNRKITTYKSAGGKKKAFTLKKGDIVKIKKVQFKKNGTYFQLVNAKGKKSWMKNPKELDWSKGMYFKECLFAG